LFCPVRTAHAGNLHAHAQTDPKELALGFDIVAKKRTQGLQREKILREIRQQQQMQEVQKVIARQEQEKRERMQALLDAED